MKQLPHTLQHEISDKGFVVYHYISFGELMQTVKRDYLKIVSAINMPMLIISGIAGLINAAALFYILPAIYFFIFLILLWKIFWRTKKYVYISRVIFTQRHILMGEDVLEYAEGWKKGSVLSEYEDEFEEYLTRDSRLKQVIEKREKIFRKQLQDIFLSGKKYDFFESDSRIGLAIMMAVYIYGISLVVFYYLGIAFGYIFFGLFAAILQGFLFFSKKIELRMKLLVEQIEGNLQNLKRTESVLEKKLSSFSGGEISDISDFVGDKFTHFYGLIQNILDDQHQLETLIVDSQYKDFIDFKIFSGYLKTQYNKPVKHMVLMLKKYAQKISDQKKIVEEELIQLNTSPDSSDPENSAHLSKKLQRFTQMETQAYSHLEKMQAMTL